MRWFIACVLVVAFGGVADSAFGQWACRIGLSRDELQVVFDRYAADGYRLVDVSGFGVGGRDIYAGIWQKQAGAGWYACSGLNARDFQRVFDEYKARGFRLVAQCGYTVDDRDYYAGIWEEGDSSEHQARFGVAADQFQAYFDRFFREGYRLVDVSGYSIADDVLYTGVWEKRPGPTWQARIGMDAAELERAFHENTRQGYRPLKLSGYAVGDEANFAVIWEQRAAPRWVARHSLTPDEFQADFDRKRQQGYQLVDVSGYTVGGEPRYTVIWDER